MKEFNVGDKVWDFTESGLYSRIENFVIEQKNIKEGMYHGEVCRSVEYVGYGQLGRMTSNKVFKTKAEAEEARKKYLKGYWDNRLQQAWDRIKGAKEGYLLTTKEHKKWLEEQK